MATIRERRKKDGSVTYNAQVRMQGYPPRTATFSTRRKAERWVKSIEGSMVDGRHFRSHEATRKTLADAVDRYLEYELPKKRSANMHKAALNWWRDKLGKTKLAEVTPALLVKYRDKLTTEPYQRTKGGRQYTRSNARVNRYVACLRHLFSVARREWHWIDTNPADGVSALPESPGRIRCLSDDERTALLAETATDDTLHLFVLVALTTACRAGELQKLTWADVDLKDGRLLFRETKNATPRTAWLHGEALRRMKRHAKVRSIHGGQVFKNDSGRGERYQYYPRFKAAVEAAGIENFRFHDLRHTAATYLARNGATEQQLKAIGGWKSGVASRYVHLAADDSREALRRLAGKVDK